MEIKVIRYAFIWMLLCQSAIGQVILQNAKLNNAQMGLTNVSGGGVATTTAVLSGHGNTRSDNQAYVGFFFTNTVSLTVKTLGRMVSSGNSGTRTVSIFEPSVSQTVPIVTLTTVSASGTTDTYNFTTCADTTLSPGHTYVIAAVETTGQSWYGDQNALTTSSQIVITGSAFYNGVAFTVGSNGSFGYVPVNFQYTVP